MAAWRNPDVLQALPGYRWQSPAACPSSMSISSADAQPRLVAPPVIGHRRTVAHRQVEVVACANNRTPSPNLPTARLQVSRGQQLSRVAPFRRRSVSSHACTHCACSSEPRRSRRHSDALPALMVSAATASRVCPHCGDERRAWAAHGGRRCWSRRAAPRAGVLRIDQPQLVGGLGYQAFQGTLGATGRHRKADSAPAGR